MEIKLNPVQSFRATLVERLNYDVAKAKECFDFIIGNGKTPVSQVTPSQPNNTDGVYYVLNNGSLTVLENVEAIKDSVVGVAVRMGDKIATVALHDACDGEEVALTTVDKCGTPEFFHSDFFDAISDWRGEDNTADYGEALNPEIGLQPNQYIPSLAQLHLILLNVKAVNAALEAVGGSPLRKEWYWSSTEGSSNYSWGVSFGNGNSSGTVGKYYTYVVRPAVACKV
jgi:hypothetical protein